MKSKDIKITFLLLIKKLSMQSLQTLSTKLNKELSIKEKLVKISEFTLVDYSNVLPFAK